MRQPKRRVERREHIDASNVPMERALLQQAGAIETEADTAADEATSKALAVVAVKFRDLAEELHFWG